ncbi:MAG: glutathione peroxidase [Ignavibacteriae bacterium]|nr:glutathione peroxidase [Ignavibacteriota bacterium]NOG99371.1 glutathione peroxidase [Ignavibacteriota bacterium]
MSKRNKLFFVIKIVTISFLLITYNACAQNEEKKAEPTSGNVHGISVLDAENKTVKLAEYKDRVLLIVNVASECGYTPQYKGLQVIYEKYKDDGFEILAFPCNDFGGQEPGTMKEIQNFCSANYDVTFKLFNKIKVLGDEKSELYKVLTNNKNVEQGDIKWNFEKFIISKSGDVVERFRSKVEPESEEITGVIEAELKR